MVVGHIIQPGRAPLGHLWSSRNNFRISTGSIIPKYCLFREERRAVQALWISADVSILWTDKGHRIVVFSTIDCDHKTASLLEDLPYRMLIKEPTKCTGYKTILLPKKSTFWGAHMTSHKTWNCDICVVTIYIRISHTKLVDMFLTSNNVEFEM